MVVITDVTDEMALVPSTREGAPLVVGESFRGKVLDRSGAQSFRGGQAVESGFLESVKASYSLLVYHPIALVFLLIGCFILIAEHHNSKGPLELIAGEILSVANSKDVDEYIRSILTLILVFLNQLIKGKLYVGKICLIWFTYICKPSSRHMTISIMLTLFSFAKFMTFLEIFVLSQLYFLFAMLRSPTYKFLIVVSFVIVFVVGLFQVDAVLSLAVENFQDLTRTGPPPPTRAVPTAATTKGRP